MASFMQAMKARAERKDTNVNPPEAAKVLEEKSAPEVANTQPAASAAAPEPSATSAEAPAASSDAGAASTEAPKAKRGRPAGSKNAPKPPADAPASEGASAADLAVSQLQSVDLQLAIAAVKRTLPAGCTITISGEYKA